ncbi:hypothetical protein, partial [Mesorhizobium sp. M2D.F.Ca.ET.178.01.1.1]|uniref:hypothetical protein n=1 Tax=Mesorhizobium sp. M2D.F.Ca.ET.178.01.1.1 TaxID=2563937 RepID=UPI001AEE93F6
QNQSQPGGDSQHHERIAIHEDRDPAGTYKASASDQTGVTVDDPKCKEHSEWQYDHARRGR